MSIDWGNRKQCWRVSQREIYFEWPVSAHVCACPLGRLSIHHFIAGGTLKVKWISDSRVRPPYNVNMKWLVRTTQFARDDARFKKTQELLRVTWSMSIGGEEVGESIGMTKLLVNWMCLHYRHSLHAIPGLSTISRAKNGFLFHKIDNENWETIDTTQSLISREFKNNEQLRHEETVSRSCQWRNFDCVAHTNTIRFNSVGEVFAQTHNKPFLFTWPVTYYTRAPHNQFNFLRDKSRAYLRHATFSHRAYLNKRMIFIVLCGD